MGKDIESYCASCQGCQSSKSTTQKPQGLLHSLPIPMYPWDSIRIDFVRPFRPSKDNFNYLMAVIDLLTSMVHLTSTDTTAAARDVAWICLRDIVRLHGLPATIVSDRDRDPKFTSAFWRGATSSPGNKINDVHSIPSSNGWCNGEGE
jgi:hypothetical protein